MANTNEQMAAEALLMLQAKPQQKRTFTVPVLKNTPFANVPQAPSVPIKRKRTKRASPSSPIPRNKGRFAKKESLFVPKPKEMKAYTRNTQFT